MPNGWVGLGLHLSSVTENSPENATGWVNAVNLLRRACILRATGSESDAAALETTGLAAALESLRETCADSAKWDARVRALRQREEERVADAMVLADILLPRLQNALQPSVGSARARPTSGPTSFSSPRPARPRNAPREIADFIDEMIAQRQPNH